MNKKIVLQFGAVFILGLILGGLVIPKFLFKTHEKPKSGSLGVSYLTQDNLQFKFIKPLLDVGYVNQEDSLRQFPLLARMKKDVQEEIDKYPDVEVGFYFNDLNNAGWFGVNEDEKFIPASLLKLPMLISYYKLRESEPNLFEQTILVKGTNLNPNRTVAEASRIEPDKTYSVGELLNAMIVDSDNNALDVLYQYKKDSLKDIFEDLKTPLPDTKKDLALKDFLSPRDMSKFFLVLYNGSYLMKKDSDEALRLLSTVKYQDGIVAGVPSDVVVSHKYGEREVSIGNGTEANEFHDCGIIYYSKSPYKLCIMTKGKDLKVEKSSQIIAKLSKIIYQDIAAGK